MMKRIVSALTGLALALLSVMTGVCGEGIPCAAAEMQEGETAKAAGAEEGGFQFTEMPNGTLKITKYTGDAARVEIPSEIGGKEVVIIGESAFSDCPDVTAITVPAGVTNIGESSATYPEHDALSGCGSLMEIIVDEGNECYSSDNGLLYNKEKTELIVCPAGKEGSLAIPEGVTGVRERAFYGCGSLMSITIPASMKSIAGANENIIRARCREFTECKNLEEIVVDNDNAVYGSQDGLLYGKGWGSDFYILLCCPPGKKGTIRIADSSEKIGRFAFWNCDDLTRIEIPASVSSVEGLKNCSSLTEIAVDGENASYASDNGILYTKDMTELVRCPEGKAGSVAVPDGVTAINGVAFDDCNGLTSIEFSKSVISFTDPDDYEIYSVTFNTCSNLEEITVDSRNQKYASLGGVLYSKDMSRLECCPPGKNGIIDIPDGVNGMRDYSFRNCNGVTGIRIPQSLEGRLGAGEDNEIENIFQYCANLSEIIVDSHNAAYYSVDGMLFVNGTDYDMGGLLACPAGKEGGVTVPEGVSYIYGGAFENCVRLNSVKLPESVQSIGWGAFQGCGNGLRLICAEGSVAETYAVENGIPYQTVSRTKKTQSITASDFTKAVGDMPFLIKASSDGGGVLSYKSGNESVASVTEEGIIVIKGAGTAQITITASETDHYKAAAKVITVTVKPKEGEHTPPESKVYTVTFDANGGTGPSEARRTKNEGDSIGALPSVKRSGYALIGWYTQKNGGTVVTPNTRVTSDMTVYARWKAEGADGSDSDKQLIRKTESVKAKIKNVKNVKKKSIMLKLGGLSGCDGYQIQYGLKKDFKGAKSVLKKSGSVTIKKLKLKKTYYVRVRAYKKIAGKPYYGKWSGRKTVKIKK